MVGEPLLHFLMTKKGGDKLNVQILNHHRNAQFAHIVAYIRIVPHDNILHVWRDAPVLRVQKN